MKEKKAYYEKYIECLNKAKISFGSDPATSMFIENYNKDRHKLHFTTTQWGDIWIYWIYSSERSSFISVWR